MTIEILTRRDLALSLASIAATGMLPKLAWTSETQPAESLQDWLRKNTIPIRSADPLDEDFSDLEPLALRIADARVVQLGEPSHGAGTAFAAKARLVKFLHERMGFDVLVWESGFFDLTRTEYGLAHGDDAVVSAKRGILEIWSASRECRPLFEYAKKSHAGKRPLVMAGFDMQLTSDSFDDLATELRAFIDDLREPRLRRDASVIASDLLDAFRKINRYVEAMAQHAKALSNAGTTGASMGEAMTRWERDTGAGLRPQTEDLHRVEEAAGHLLRLLDQQRSTFEKINGQRQLGFVAHLIANLAGYAANMYEQFRAGAPTGSAAELIRESRRDALNAENLRWLIEEGYPGQKLIVWAHNVHVMNSYYGSDWKSVSFDPAPNKMKPMGVFLAERLGNASYTVGITAYEGEDAWVGGTPSSVAPAPEDSIEERLYRLGYDFAFLDMRSARDAVDNPLHGAQTMRVPKYDAVELTDVTRPFDAIVFIKRMKPATSVANE